MTNPLLCRARKLHLDLHTPAEVRDVCAAFDPDEFGDTLREAHINAAVVFIKCHYGMSYYPTKVGVVHPGLSFDLLGAMVQALRKRDIAISAYYSVGYDGAAFDVHPDWRLTLADGSGVVMPRSNFKFMCVNSAYVQELIWPQLQEVIRTYDVDGLWFDIIRFVPESCYCVQCQDMLRREGLDPKHAVAHEAFNEASIGRFMRTTTALAKGLNPRLACAYNSHMGVGRVATKSPAADVLEIEFGPSRHGFYYLPLHARYQRTRGNPTIAVNTTFLNGWGDFGTLKPRVQLKYEAASALALGSLCNLGDQLPPDGRLTRAAYEAIGETYAFVEERERWCIGAQSVKQVALVVHTQPQSEVHGRKPPTGALAGALKALCESHVQFDVLDEDSPLEGYQAVVLESEHPSPAALERLRRFVFSGGKLLAFGSATLAHDDQGCLRFGLEDVLGVRYEGHSSYTVNYLDVADEALGAAIPAMSHVLNERCVEVSPIDGVRTLASLRYPYLEVAGGHSFSHQQAPPSVRTPFHSDAIVRHPYGSGEAIYCTPSLLRLFCERQLPVYRRLIANALGMLLGDSALVLTSAPPSVELSLMRQDGRWILHLLNYHAEKRAGWNEIIEEIPPRHDLVVSLRKPGPVRRVYLAPSNETLDYEEQDGRLVFFVRKLEIHQMVVVDYGD